MKNVKSISENDIICHSPVNNLTGLSFDHHKVVFLVFSLRSSLWHCISVFCFDHICYTPEQTRRRVPKNRRMVEDEVKAEKNQSALSVRLILRELALEFLNGAYNSFMSSVKVSPHTVSYAKERSIWWGVYWLSIVGFAVPVI